MAALLTSAAIAVIAGCAAQPQAAPRLDAAITSDIDAQIASNATLSPHDLTVVTTNGVVHLAGRVPLESDRAAVQRLARRTAGVRSVDNFVQFGGSPVQADTVTD